MTWEKSGGYPVPGTARSSSIAWAVLDELATQTMIHGAVREALYVRLRTLVEQGEQDAANQVLHAFLDCWALGSLVDQARADWHSVAEPGALSVLVRAAEIIQLAIGWPAGPAGPWPVPDDSWFSAKERRWAESPSRPMEGIGEVDANALIDQRAGWVSRLVSGELNAIHVTGIPADSAAYQLALGEIRMEACKQRYFDRAGFAATHVDAVPDFGQDWSDPPEGSAGRVLMSVADGVVVPALDTGAPMAMVGWLVWPDAHRPRRVHPVAVAALQGLDGSASSMEVAERLEIDPERWAVIEDSLLRLGAATAVSSL